MHLGDYRVQIVQRPLLAPYRIFMFRSMDTRTVEYITKNGAITKDHEELAKEEFDEKEMMLAEMTDAQLRAFASAMSDMGIKPRDISLAEGRLEAQSKHLEDMRALVFKLPRSEKLRQIEDQLPRRKV